MITKQTTLADVVRDYPQAIPFFNELHLDYCCGGNIPMEEAVQGKDINVDTLLKELMAYINSHKPSNAGAHASLEDFKKLSIPAMLEDLEQTHHVTDRQLMGGIETDLNKILLVHYEHHGELLTRLHHLFTLLKGELEEHFAKEEKKVFPLMRSHPNPTRDILRLVRELEEEHTNAGDLIKEMQRVTDQFTPPEDACPTFKRTYSEMQTLFEDLFVHIFKENSIVFPEYEEQGEVQTDANRDAVKVATDIKLENCGLCRAETNPEKSEVLYECGDCGATYCDDWAESGCPQCGAPFSHAHPIERSGSSWNSNMG